MIQNDDGNTYRHMGLYWILQTWK